jgi:serine protease Do
MYRFNRLFSFFAVLFAFIAPGIATAGQPQPAVMPQVSPSASPIAPDTKLLLQQLQGAFTGIAKTSEPWVVNVEVLKVDDSPTATGSNDPSKPNGATGSGLIIRSDGYILTNDHVIDGATEVTVSLSDGREFPGTVAGDFRSDLAVIKINAGAPLPVAPFGDSDAVVPGQWAIAIGSPFDLQNTLTVGVISAINRQQTIGDDAESARYYPDLIQTDAAINPGNSGGPLLNIDGQVIGINVAIESPVEGSSGVGFAIPSNYAQSIVNDLITKGAVIRGYLGIAPKDLTPALQTEFGVTTGAWVEQVNNDSPAGKAGIHATDVITSFNGKPVTGELSLREAISATAPGTAVPVELVRNEAPINLTVTIAPPPVNQQDVNPTTVKIVPRKLGVSVRTLTPTDRQENALGTSLQGAFVTSVVPNSPADLAGLSQGDVITQIGRSPITSADDFTKALAQSPDGQPGTVVIVRSVEGKVSEIAINLQP